MTALSVGGALVFTGGPMTGRSERRDETRMNDLRRLSSQVQCLATNGPRRLPSELAPTPACPSEVRLADPYTAAAYRFEPVEPDSYRVCADFEHPLKADDWQSDLDVARGCLVGHLPPPPPPDLPTGRAPQEQTTEPKAAPDQAEDTEQVPVQVVPAQP
ncbi:hypothetical protein DRW48_00435 [Paracoccus suum]|uniref:Uncharacterized protein n=1 Tax=Paracoccus suum TaxID=2259340 RepID=A0A344PG68_9RHOB|nr:hypothetical protein DRW48_00435 [Paracoccus suum]